MRHKIHKIFLPNTKSRTNGFLILICLKKYLLLPELTIIIMANRKNQIFPICHCQKMVLFDYGQY